MKLLSTTVTGFTLAFFCGIWKQAQAELTHTCMHDHISVNEGAIAGAEQNIYPQANPDAEEMSPLHGRRLATHCGGTRCPIRVTVEYSPGTLVPTGDLTAARIATLKNDIIPAAVARLQGMYLVQPVAGRLTFSRTCQTLCSSSGDPRFGLCQTYADPSSSPAVCDLSDNGANNPFSIPLSYYGDQSNTCGGLTNNYPAPSGPRLVWLTLTFTWSSGPTIQPIAPVAAPWRMRALVKKTP